MKHKLKHFHVKLTKHVMSVPFSI